VASLGGGRQPLLALAEQRVGTQPVALDEDWSVRHRAFHLALYAGASSPAL
jgi:hypothetical protein